MQSFREGELAHHNYYRELHNDTGLLELDDDLNDDAQTWAEFLAQTGTFSHEANIAHGENLYYAFHPNSQHPYCNQAPLPEVCEYVNGSASASWYNEIQYYDYATTRSTDAAQQIGHFTQVVWKDSTQVGFGRATMRDGGYDTEYIVARYNTPGNFVIMNYGQTYEEARVEDYTANVKPLKS